MLLKELQLSFIKNADKNAFCINEHHYSYKEFNDRVKAIYHTILSKQFDHPITIGIVTTNTIETYASVFACWFSGNSYVPLNPSIPTDRNTVIVKQAGLELVLSSEKSTEEVFQNADQIEIVSTSPLTINEERHADVQELDEDTLLYILFTSGSTGMPKGVPISCGNIVSFLDSYHALGFEHTAADRFLQMFDLTFDVSVASFLVPLLCGACVYTVPSEGIKYMSVYKIIKKHKITFASIVPSIINYLKPYFNEINLPDLKYCILTAEASNVHIAKEWANCIPNGKIVNLYGPTEATIWCTGYFFTGEPEKSYNEMMIIGKPFKHVEAVILNELGEEVPAGEKGELNITSSQLTKGYLNDSARNNSAFFFRNGKRFYKTGDLCYVDNDGNIFYCGRIDHQVKIQGFRIELSEIEVTVRELFAVNNVAVVYRDTKGVDNICLFTESLDFNEAAIKEGLEKKLPYYMLPAQINNIQTLPYNTSGKVDRVGLSRLASINGK
jgi:D-alanine--poly(phosphoribitol) ligase subunit 1